MNFKKLLISFILIASIAILSGVFTINKMNELTDNTRKMYTHPFTVSNAVANIQTSIITMHRNMKDIVLSKESLEIVKQVEAIQHLEDKVLKNFSLIYKNYLGNKKDIDACYNAFVQWRAIREEVITNIYDNKKEEAIAITKGKGALHINKIYDQIEALKTFAFNKAEHFYTNAMIHNGVDQVIYVIISAIVISALIILYIINTLLKINRANNKQLHLIDQNILTAKINLDKEVIDISNALCRALKIKKEQILNHKSPYFFTSKEQFEQFENIIYSSKDYSDKVYIAIEDKKVWFHLEVLPTLDHNFQLKAFNLFLTNINDRKKIEEIAIVDTLTGLNNRNYFETIFEKEIKRAKRDKKAFSMVMLDIDYFKQYNDSYGHQEGDKALKAVSHVLEKHTNRSYDYAFRIGGEEFVILSYHESLNTLKTFSQSLIDDVHQLKIPHKSSKVSDFLTISAGAALFQDSHLHTPDEMYKTTDDLLYRAKKEGRNRIITSVIA